jgi:3-phenylpropionate/trans-cinnamate dioxygenase ferredoxin subunit
VSAVTVARFDDLVDGGALRVDVEGHRLAVVRVGDDVHVVDDRCTHADFSLSEGEVDVDTCHIECWKHGSSFSLLTGAPDSFPATRPVNVYEVHVADGDVVVTLPEAREVAVHV